MDNYRLTHHWDPAEVGRVAERRARWRAPLDRLEAAVAIADELREVGDEVLDRFVADTRTANHSWSEVGTVLVTSERHRTASARSLPVGSASRQTSSPYRPQRRRRLLHR